MTLLASWIGVDNSKFGYRPSSIYITTDSHFSSDQNTPLLNEGQEVIQFLSGLKPLLKSSDMKSSAFMILCMFKIKKSRQNLDQLVLIVKQLVYFNT